jgi:hypothetical protein
MEKNVGVASAAGTSQNLNETMRSSKTKTTKRIVKKRKNSTSATNNNINNLKETGSRLMSDNDEVSRV